VSLHALLTFHPSIESFADTLLTTKDNSHRFWAHSSGKDNLVFKVWAKPQDLDHSFDENFLRNFVGYQRDCEREGINPSTFQLILMSYNSATIATPPFWMPIWILKMVHYVLAYWVAAALLGHVCPNST